MEKTKSSNSSSEKELDKALKSFESFDQSIKEMTLDRMNASPRLDQEEQTKLSSRDLAKSKEIYLKPKRTISSKEPFNEKFREQYEFSKQMVCFVAENREVIGETIDIWTKKFPGVPAEEWEVPVNKPVWGPRYLAEQIKGCSYHRFSMKDQVTSNDGVGSFYGTMVVDNTVQRLDAIPHTPKKSIFMGAEGF